MVVKVHTVGGAFSGKDSSKADRSAAHATRHIATRFSGACRIVQASIGASILCYWCSWANGNFWQILMVLHK